MLQRSSSSGIRLGLLAALAGALVLGASGGMGPSRPRRTPTAAPAAKPAQKAAGTPMNACATCLERGVLLFPSQLANGTEPDVRLSYEAARKYPDTLDRLHCFCECKESLLEHHKTLLTCFTTTHAAGCGVCQREANLAATLKDQGLPDEQVELKVESLFRTDGHPPTFGRGL